MVGAGWRGGWGAPVGALLVAIGALLVAFGCSNDPYGDTSNSPSRGATSGGGTSGGGSTSSSGGGDGDGGSSGGNGGDTGGPRVGCHGQTDCERYVFVTSQRYDANLDGPAGADQKCQILADQGDPVLYGRSFRAWVSSRSAPATARHPQGAKPYRLVDGTVVASSWADLTDGTLQHAIDQTEKRGVYQGDVWTGTNVRGETVSANCDDWETTGGIGGSYGRSSATGSEWTAATGSRGCATDLALYCVEY